MAKVTPNVASMVVPGVVKKVVAKNPSMSPGSTSAFAGFNPARQAGDTAKGVDGSHFAARNAGNGNKVFVNEAKRSGTDNIDQAFYAHIK